MKDDNVYLKHISEALEKIDSYLKDTSYEAFSINDLINDAVIRELEIVGEAAAKISAEYRKKHPEVPWNQMAGMRNKLIHEYFGIDKKIVWETCQTDLKALSLNLKPLLNPNLE